MLLKKSGGKLYGRNPFKLKSFNQAACLYKNVLLTITID